jgi:hypothetical protein
VDRGNPYDQPYLTIYQSSAVPRGSGIRFGDKLFLNPADAATLRRQAVSDNKYEATFGPTPTPTKRELKRAARKERTRKLPLPAKIGAGVVLVLLLVVLPVSCGISAHNAGVAYDECIQQIAQEQGHEAAKLAEAQGECK